MATPRIELRIVNEDITVATTRDMKLNDDLVIQEWSDQLLRLLEEEKVRKLVVNFDRVMFMSSSALRGLITLNRKITEYNHNNSEGKYLLVLCCIDDNILEAFRITKLDSVFTIRPTEDEAVRTIVAQSA